MPCLSGSFDRSLGVVIQLGVVPSGTDLAQLGSNARLFPALLDTGASATCISPLVVSALGLAPIGKRPMVSATGAVPKNVYLVHLLVPFGQVAHFVRDAQVMEFDADQNTPFQILIGRDIICQGALTMSFDGHFTFSL